jgi:Fic family protein
MEASMTLFQSAPLGAEELRVIDAISDTYRQLKYALSTPSIWTGVLRRNAFARAIQGSNSIEGYRVTVEDAVAAAEGEPPQDAQTTTWEAITGYRDALTYVLQLARDPNFSFNDGFLRGFHFMMMRYEMEKNPGNWRPGPIFVWDDKKKENVYEGPPAESARKLMGELITYLNGPIDSKHVLIKGAMAHLNLVMIHPFSDGNGRMARCLQTLVLALKGIVDPTFCSIEEYLGANTEEYYRVLGDVGQGSWHPENDTRSWIRFNLTAHYRQATTALRRTRTTSKLWNGLEQEIKKAKLPDRVIYALNDAAVGMRVRSSNYRHMAELSKIVASRDLKALVKSGLLVPQGERRGRVYIASDAIRQMAIQIRAQEPKVNMDPFVPDILASP